MWIIIKNGMNEEKVLRGPVDRRSRRDILNESKVSESSVIQSYCIGHFEFQLTFWVCNQINMIYILCQRRRVYAGKKRGISIPKRVKSKKWACAVLFT